MSLRDAVRCGKLRGMKSRAWVVAAYLEAVGTPTKIAAIAASTGLSERTVRRALRDLRLAGVVHVSGPRLAV